MTAAPLVAFLGPSLPAAAARAAAGPIRLLPPAGRGDVWRALSLRPRAIALVDGVFEARPSVWHREILEALEAGIAVFGGASMGALRAAELGPFGMIGIGRIHRWLADGTIEDDSEVALLHAGPDDAWRSLTVPLVNVRWVARCARARGVLASREASALVDAAASIFYQDRIWPGILARLGRRWSRAGRARFAAYAARGLPDLKALDAAACLRAASEFARAKAAAPRPAVPRWPAPSPLVRARLAGGGLSDGRGAERALLAAVARSLGLRADPAAVDRARRAFARERGWTERQLQAALGRAGLNAAEALRFFEDCALARLATDRGPRLWPGVDGPNLAGRFERRLDPA